MPLSRQEEMDERKSILENDQRLRNQGTTFHQFGTSEAETPKGRFTAHDTAQVVGATPVPSYIGAPNWAHDPVPQENPTGIDINAIEPTGEKFEVERSLSVPTSSASTPLAEHGDPTLDRTPRGVGSPTFSSRTYRRF